MAALLSSIILVFLLCHTTKLITSGYEAYQMINHGKLIIWPQWAEILSRVNHFMLAINASINIFIYVVKVRLDFSELFFVAFCRTISSELLCALFWAAL